MPRLVKGLPPFSRIFQNFSGLLLVIARQSHCPTTGIASSPRFIGIYRGSSQRQEGVGLLRWNNPAGAGLVPVRVILGTVKEGIPSRLETFYLSLRAPMQSGRGNFIVTSEIASG